MLGYAAADVLDKLKLDDIRAMQGADRLAEIAPAVASILDGGSDDQR